MRNILLLTMLFFGAIVCQAQMRQVYSNPDSSVEVSKISFYNAQDGYVAFKKFIGFTQDSGRTFVKKYITLSNVNYNGYQVNLTIGFTLQGVHAFNQDTLIAYGHYGFVPAILFSADQGNTYTLVFHSTLVQGLFNYGVLDMSFPDGGRTGFAVDGDRILLTTNRGQSWSSIKNDPSAEINHLSFANINTGFAFSSSKIYKIQNSGSLVQQLTFPANSIDGVSFLNTDTGWVNANSGVYYTTDGGINWTLQNTGGCYPISTSGFAFTNDSTGYALSGYDVVKTTDAGKIWERLERDNKFSYLNYGHNDLRFYSPTQFWAGGGHGFMELTTNSGGNTFPKACFSVDISLLYANTVSLVNQSKQGYAYQWYKNNALLSTTYNTSYTTPRLGFDTIMLIVIKGAVSDTATQIVDTRSNTAVCDAWYTFTTDTAAAKFQSVYDAFGAVHTWDYGDGIIDSGVANPTHIYSVVGTYNVKHSVRYSPTGCTDVETQSLFIRRTRKCLQGYIAYAVADTFFTNRYQFIFHPDTTTEYLGGNFTLSWDFVDGTTGIGGNGPVHAYDSSKLYDVVLTAINGGTNCVTTVTAAVPIQVDNGCRGDFIVQTSLAVPIKFFGHPTTNASNKRHEWIFYNRDTVYTHDTGYVERSFFTPTYDGSIVESIRANTNSGTGCYNGQINTYDFSGLNVPVKHIMTDTVTGCVDSATTVFRIPTLSNINLIAAPYPKFPYLVRFDAGNLDNQTAFNSIWRLYHPNQYEGGGTTYTGSYNGNNWNQTCLVSGYAAVAVTSPTCNPVSNYREAYQLNYYGPVLGNCDYYPIDFTYTATGLPNQYKFTADDTADYVNFGIMDWHRKWYFETTDSSTIYSPTYTFTTYSDSFQVTLKYTSPYGCEGSLTKKMYNILPVKLISFKTKRKGKAHLLIWETASEQNNAGFEVEMSIDGVNFNKLGFVKSKAANGNSNAPNMYDFINENPSANVLYYRLRQTDKDGNGVYSKMVKIENENVGQVHTIFIYPNPAANVVYVECEKMSQLSITDITGRVLMTRSVAENNKIQLQINHLLPGIYMVKVRGSDNSIQSEKLIVSKK